MLNIEVTTLNVFHRKKKKKTIIDKIFKGINNTDSGSITSSNNPFFGSF